MQYIFLIYSAEVLTVLLLS